MNSPLAQAADATGPAPRGLAPASDRGAIDDGSSLARAARVFATRCHARQQRGDGAPYIEHPLEVALLLRGAGCSDAVVAAGLLHDVLEITPVSADELTACFGAEVAGLVRAVSDDGQIGSYRDRKQRLREQVRRAGGEAAMLFAADKISTVRELTAAPAPGGSHTTRAGRVRGESRRDQQRRLQLEHYHESLEMLRSVAPRHPLVHRLADELAHCPRA